MSGKFPEWRMTGQKIAMSEKVGKLLKFMQETACVHVQEREMIAMCEVYGLINPDDKEFNEYLEKVIKPSLIKVGQSRWYRDTITDLGFALSARDTTKREEDTTSILEVDVKR